MEAIEIEAQAGQAPIAVKENDAVVFVVEWLVDSEIFEFERAESIVVGVQMG